MARCIWRSCSSQGVIWRLVGGDLRGVDRHRHFDGFHVQSHATLSILSKQLVLLHAYTYLIHPYSS